VADAALAEKMAQVLERLGCHHALVVHGEDGLDEMTLGAPTLVHELKDGSLRSYSVAPEDVGLTRVDCGAVKGGSPDDNAAALRTVLDGQRGPLRDIVLLNSAAALLAADIVAGLAEGVTVAAAAIDSGAAARALDACGGQTVSG
jgi:anthranilate phosphoribosyltransferase